MSRIGQIARMAGVFVPPGLVRNVSGPAAVFFHGVEPETDDPRIQTNHHTTDAFVEMMRILKASFDVRPLRNLDEVMKNPETHRRTVFLMSDDGYANTLTHAADILGELKLPWTLFVSTEHIDKGIRNPVFLARLFVLFAPEGTYELPHLENPVVLNGHRERLAEAVVERLKTKDAGEARETIDAMMRAFPDPARTILLNRFGSDAFLDWAGVRVLAMNGVEIGAHAHWHWPMNAYQSEETLYAQATMPKARIESEVGPCRYFAYPFGNIADIGPAAWRAVQSAGYEAAFTTLSGTIARDMNRFLLPRYGLGQRDTGLGTLIPLLRAGNPRVRRFQTRLAS